MELRDIRVFILAGAGKEVMTLGFLCNSAYAEILQGGYKVKTEITCAIEPARELLKPRTSKANKEYDAVFLKLSLSSRLMMRLPTMMPSRKVQSSLF